MSCDFKPGDELVCISTHGVPWLVEGRTYTCSSLAAPEVCSVCGDDSAGINLAERPQDEEHGSYCRLQFRKVERRTDSLSIEAFLTIKPGFEEPKRAPAKKRERVS